MLHAACNTSVRTVNSSNDHDPQFWNVLQVVDFGLRSFGSFLPLNCYSYESASYLHPPESTIH